MLLNQRDMVRNPEISIIIPTLAETKRGPALLRAIRSIHAGQGAPARPIVVVNGDRFDPELVATLARDPRLQLEQIARPGLPNALNHGRSVVKTPYFGFLDDDDILLPSALGDRLAVLAENPVVDAVVSWGETVDATTAGSRRFIERRPTADVMDERDPLRALLRGNWLASCGALYRSDRIGPEYFDPEMYFLEWTSVAIRLALTRTVRFLHAATPHFRIFETPDSLSRSRAYLFGVEKSLGRILTLDLPADVHDALAARRIREWHTISERMRHEGELATAWRYRARVLASRDTLKYLLACRHLLGATLQHMVVSQIQVSRRLNAQRQASARPVLTLSPRIR